MTSRTSLFNKGIYKSTLRRFVWGSVLYFAILFMITGMIIMMNEEPNMGANAEDIHILLRYGTYLVPAILIGIVVSTITAMLVYRFAHSKKQAVFTHSLPVSRETNFISTALAGLTLMAAPIVLNTLVLIAMSLSAYGYLFTVSDCLMWMGVNLLCVFVMFSYSTLAAMLTGNTFAIVALNILLHTFFALLSLGFESISVGFLYGFADTNDFLVFVAENNPVVWIMMVANAVSYETISVDVSKIVLNIIAALILYALSYVSYRKRRMETAEDVAAFKVLNPIYKYFITFIAALGSFGFFMNIRNNDPKTLIIAVIIVSALAYFGSEMALKKTLNVWRSAKGYAVFLVAFAAMLAVFAFTSFFGYETYIPQADNVESVAVYNYYYGDDEPFVENKDIKTYALKLHNEILEGKDAKDKWFAGAEKDTYINIKYKLKNGSVVHRRYGMDNETVYEVMNALYKHEDYKRANEEIFKQDIDTNIARISIDGILVSEEKKYNELLECIRKDVLMLDYNQMHVETLPRWNIYCNIEYYEKNENQKIIRNINKDINANYKNTIQWMKDNGHWGDDYILPGDGFIIGIDHVTYNEMRDVSYSTGIGPSSESTVEYLYKIEDENDIIKTIDFIQDYEIRILPDKQYYVICSYWVDEKGNANHDSRITAIDEDSFRELLDLLDSEVPMQ